MKDILVTMETTMQAKAVPAQQIPNLDLYVDQIITMLDERLAHTKRGEKDKVITKTMVNNYSKDGMLKRIKGKKYSREHVLMLLLICGLKQGLAVQDIARILAGLEGRLSGPEGQYGKKAVDGLYALHESALDLTSATLPDYIRNLMSLMGGSNADDPMPAIMVLTAVSALCRHTAESLIDECFPAVKGK